MKTEKKMVVVVVNGERSEAATREIIACERWRVAAKDAGQMIEIARGTDADGERWEREHDRQDRTTRYRYLGHVSDGSDVGERDEL